MRSSLRTTGVIGAVLLLACGGPAPRWYRGNLHTHTLWSDGDAFPEQVVDWYRSHGYQFLVISDHNILLEGEKWLLVDELPNGETSLEDYRRRFGPDRMEERVDENGRRLVRLKNLDELQEQFEVPGRFILVPGEEITDRFETKLIHVNATNLAEFIPPWGGVSVVAVMRNNIRAVLEQRERTGRPMLPHLSHPNFVWAVTAEDLLEVGEERFFEVYNGHPLVRNAGDSLHASAERIWDIILTKRLAEQGLGPMYCLAVDDAHHYHDSEPSLANPGRGWVMVQADGLTPETIVAALEAGDFYATTGVRLVDVRVTPDRLALRIEREKGIRYTTRFIGTRWGYDPASQPVVGTEGQLLGVTRRYSDTIGEVLAEVEGTTPAYRFAGDELYVRAKVISTKPKAGGVRDDEVEVAWIQPVVPETTLP